MKSSITQTRHLSGEIPIAACDSEEMIYSEPQPSHKTSGHPPTREKPDSADRDGSPNVKQNNSPYPSPVRLTFLTFGLMAVVLMVALDNYILGPSSHPLTARSILDLTI